MSKMEKRDELDSLDEVAEVEEGDERDDPQICDDRESAGSLWALKCSPSSTESPEKFFFSKRTEPPDEGPLFIFRPAHILPCERVTSSCESTTPGRVPHRTTSR
jgi:hypothetical protein